MKFGEVLREALKQNDLTQREAAEALYVTQQAVSDWVNNKSIPSLDKCVDIYELLGVDLVRVRGRNHMRRGGSLKMEVLKIKNIDTYDEAVRVSKELLKNMNIEEKYSHAVYMLLTWLLPATIGLTNHQRINNREADFEYDMYDVMDNLSNFMDDMIPKKLRGKFENQLEYDFYKMGGDLFESGVELVTGELDYLEDHDYCQAAMEDWERFSRALIKHPSSNIYAELIVAITEIANG